MISLPLDPWIQTHPLLHWLTRHPLSTIGLGLLSLFLLSGLLSAISRLGEQLWLRLLRSPIALLSSLSTRIQSIRPAAKPDRVGEILDRIEELRQEEAGLIAEMRQLVGKGE